MDEIDKDIVKALRALAIVTVSASLGDAEVSIPLTREIVARGLPDALAPQLARRVVSAFRHRGLPLADGDYVLVGIDGTVFDGDRDFTLADFPPSSATTDERERCQCFLWPRAQLAHRCEHPGCDEWAESIFRVAGRPAFCWYHGVARAPGEPLRLCGRHAYELYREATSGPPQFERVD